MHGYTVEELRRLVKEGIDSEAAADRLLDRVEARWQQLTIYPF